MGTKIPLYGVVLALALGFGVVGALAAPVTFASLMGEMTDLERLTHAPDPAYTSRQFSSYDRKSTDPAILTDENWFANADRGQHIRTETNQGREEWVMADVEGPGAIVRIWSANPDDAGICRIYLDGAEKPALDLPLTEMLAGNSLTGSNVLFRPPIVGKRSRGMNSHLPIPYAKHCKVTADQPNFYYHVNVRTYAPGTEVETITDAAIQAAVPAFVAALKGLTNPATEAQLPENGTYQGGAQRLAIGEKRTVIESSMSGGAVYALKCQVPLSDTLEAQLRSIVLRISFDGEDTPAVEAPLGDFFGSAPGLYGYESLPSGMLNNGSMYSHWVMPFRESVSISLENLGSEMLEAELSALIAPREWTDDSYYFHARWRKEDDIPTRPRQDWNYVSVKGAGRFVGHMLNIANPVRAWWGEGDEKIYVDDESFPSTFGTGTEDYYGYAWGNPEPFFHAYHNQTRCDGPANFGHTCVNRFHIMDDIPFTSAFNMDMEVWHWQECKVSMASLPYWYAAPEATDNQQPISPAMLTVPAYEPPWPKKVEGALEAEDLAITVLTGGSSQVQDILDWSWSGAKQLWWIDGKPGDQMEIEFEVKESGKYEVVANFTKAPDYGMAEIRLDNQVSGHVVDFYAPEGGMTGEISLGTHGLPEGYHRIDVYITGTNPAAEPKRHMVGLDYILLKTVPCRY